MPVVCVGTGSNGDFRGGIHPFARPAEGLAGTGNGTGKVALTEEERRKVLMEVERQQTEFGTEK